MKIITVDRIILHVLANYYFPCINKLFYCCKIIVAIHFMLSFVRANNAFKVFCSRSNDARIIFAAIPFRADYLIQKINFVSGLGIINL